jgi:hypothetical protein
MHFSEQYGHLRTYRAVAREDQPAVQEHVVQCIWYDQLFDGDSLITDDGRTLKIHSPGWWNHGEGPDFKGAQFVLGGKSVVGDIEVHLTHGAWKQHGHGMDENYDEVRLHVVLQDKAPREQPRTSMGRPIPSLLLTGYLKEDIGAIAARIGTENYPYETMAAHGTCASLVRMYGSDRLHRLLDLAGEWRMLNKARALRERMELAGDDQAIYEAFMTACGYSQFKQHFRLLARQFPNDRVVQLAQQDPLLVEAAFFQLAGLLPSTLPETTGAAPHFARLRAHRRDHLSGLKALPITWRLTGVRPTNYPERRLAGAAVFLARTAKSGGLAQTLDHIWREDMRPLARRRAFEGLFPKAMGFWASHCSWTGKKMHRATALLGPGRVRGIIGNVFVPTALAVARQRRDRALEGRAMEFFASLPKESDNHILKVMVPRLFGDDVKPKMDFRTQQGLLQMYSDWCEPNPSCQNCRVIPSLDIDDQVKEE